jgi:hypothetical protein
MHEKLIVGPALHVANQTINTRLAVNLNQYTWNTMLWGLLQKKQNRMEITDSLWVATPVPMSNWNSEKEITNWKGGTVEFWNSEEWDEVAHVRKLKATALQAVICYFVIGSF